MSRYNSSERTPQNHLITAVILIAAALIMFGIGAMKLTTYNHLKKVCTETTTGIVTSVDVKRRTRRRGSGYNVYSATAEFTVKDTVYSCTSPYNRYFSSANVGSSASINYNPVDPSESYFTSVSPDSGLFQLIMAATFGVLGIVDYIKYMKKRPKNDGFGSNGSSGMKTEFDFSKF